MFTSHWEIIHQYQLYISSAAVANYPGTEVNLPSSYSVMQALILISLICRGKY